MRRIRHVQPGPIGVFIEREPGGLKQCAGFVRGGQLFGIRVPGGLQLGPGGFGHRQDRHHHLRQLGRCRAGHAAEDREGDRRVRAAEPNIKIKSTPYSFSDILHQDILQTTAGNPPDVSQIAGNDTAALIATNAIQPLDSIAPASFLQGIYPSEIALGKKGGKLYAIPWIVAPLGFWYNKTVMKQAGLDPTKPPTTLDQWTSDMKTIKAKEGASGVVPFGLDTTKRTFGMDVNWPIMLSFGAHPLGASAPDAASSQMQTYLQWVRTVNQDGYTLPGKLLGEFRPLAAQNKLGFAFDGPYLQGVIQSLNKSLTDQQFNATWSVTSLPAGPDGKHYTIPTDHQLVMFKAAKNKAAAWKFMEFLVTNKDAIQTYTLPSGSIPPTTNGATEFPKQLGTPVMKAFISKVLPTVVSPDWGPLYSKAYAPIMSGVEEAASGKTPIATIAKNMQSQLQPLYKK
ncbi:MAG: extracellular solute-binding protein [Chloroflexota bacterium]